MNAPYDQYSYLSNTSLKPNIIVIKKKRETENENLRNQFNGIFGIGKILNDQQEAEKDPISR